MRRLILIPTCGLALAFSGCSGNRELAQKDLYIDELEAHVSDLKGQVATRDQQIRELESRPPQVIEKDPSDAVRQELAGSGADVSWRHGELIIGLESDILFRPGSATLTSQAKRSLSNVAGVVKRRYTGNYVRIEGHTDSDPIRRSKKTWSDNWHLSGGRGRAVLAELVKLGINAELISFAGYADKRPVADNSSRTGKAQNRRVEIVVLPKR
jgi:chemotaxis protein MotB